MTQRQPEISIVGGNWDSISGLKRFSHKAMATTFEVVILHTDACYARQAAFAAFDELDRLEQELSRFIENSDISRINNLPPNQPLPIGLDAFECLRLSARIHADTKGAFDITIGSLMDCWFNDDKTMRKPSTDELNSARRRTGMQLMALDEAEHTVQLMTAQVQVDLGGIGKGYAVDRMAELLRDWSIDAALIHGGYSSVLAVGVPPGKKGWPVTLSSPRNRKQILACLDLRDRALSSSGLQKGRHIIDPRTAKPVEGKIAAWACATDAATADALSTAFMVMSPEEVNRYCSNHPNALAMLVIEQQHEEGKKDRILHFGRWDKSNLLKQ